MNTDPSSHASVLTLMDRLDVNSRLLCKGKCMVHGDKFSVCELIPGSLRETNVYVSTIKQTFYRRLLTELEELGFPNAVEVNGPSPLSPGRILNLRFNGVDNETLLLMLDSEGVCASAGSACRAHEVTPSRTLLAMGLTPDEARSSVRFSFSEFNDTDEAEQGAKIAANAVAFLLHDRPAAEEQP